MRSYDHTSSPVLALPSQNPPQPRFNMGVDRPIFSSPFGNGINTYSNLTPNAFTPTSAAGRKRSRDEAAPNLEEDYFPVQQPNSVPAPPENEDEWEYGEGMTLIKPSRTYYTIPAGSQTGTWAEEKAEEKTQIVASSPSPERPLPRSAKSQRLNLKSTPVTNEGVISNGTVKAPTSVSLVNGAAEPTVDDFTRHLGIGWSSISKDEDIQAAARGWTKFIDNHFPVTHAKIRLQSRGLASYLVEANEGYFLFSEDLKQGRLVSTSLEKTWTNLRGPVPVFDGEGTMEAGETPKINGNSQLRINDEPVMTGIEGQTANVMQDPLNHTLEVDMDMTC